MTFVQIHQKYCPCANYLEDATSVSSSCFEESGQHKLSIVYLLILLYFDYFFFGLELVWEGVSKGDSSFLDSLAIEI